MTSKDPPETSAGPTDNTDNHKTVDMVDYDDVTDFDDHEGNFDVEMDSGDNDQDSIEENAGSKKKGENLPKKRKAKAKNAIAPTASTRKKQNQKANSYNSEDNYVPAPCEYTAFWTFLVL